MAKEPSDGIAHDDGPAVELDPCSRSALARHPPLDGRSNNRSRSGVQGIHCRGGIAISGLSFNGTAVFAQSLGSGRAIFATSETKEAIYAESEQADVSTIIALSGRPRLEENRVPAAIWGASQAFEGVHGETRSTRFSALVGIQLNASSETAAVWGEHKGGGLAGYFKGDLIVTGEIGCRQADCAEQFDIAGDAVGEPGTVMVFDANGALMPAVLPYDRRVAGIISGAGPFNPALVLDKQGRNEPGRAPLALMGKVYCKVDAGFAPIAAGDMLTTSAHSGHAMKASDPVRAFGAVVGKALRPLDRGTGHIPVLVTLQ